MVHIYISCQPLQDIRYGINNFNMENELVFQPDRRLGLVFHILASLLLSAVGTAGLWASIHASTSIQFFLIFLPSLLLLSSVPFLLYYFYALRSASYRIERDGIRLQWGLRREDIPMSEILWVQPSHMLDMNLPLPFFRWPGAVIGARRLRSGGEIEYLASSTRDLLVIARLEQAFLISPTDPAGFIHAYQRFTEMGSFLSFEPVSIYPVSTLNQVWRTIPARFLILLGAVSSIVLFIATSLAVSSNSEIYLRILTIGSSGEPVPAIRLLLLPILNSIIFLIDLFMGLFFFLDQQTKHLAFLVWGAGLVTSLFFMGGVYFILQPP